MRNLGQVGNDFWGDKISSLLEVDASFYLSLCWKNVIDSLFLSLDRALKTPIFSHKIAQSLRNA